MNKTTETFCRDYLKTRLALLEEKHRLFFKRMYSHKNLDAPIDDVVDSMPSEKLDWAMSQVERTLKKL